MSNFAERLRRREHNHFDEMPGCLDCEAADEIERLEALNAQLMARLGGKWVPWDERISDG